MKSGYDQFFKDAQKAKKIPPKPLQKKSVSPTSKQMAEQLRQRLTPKKIVKRGTPWKMIATSFIGLAITVFGLVNLEKIEHYCRRIEISFLGTASAEEAKETKETKAAAKTEEKDKKEEVKETKKEFTQEEVNHFAKLNERKHELDAREAELSRMETELQTQKVELEKRLQELEQTRKSISQVLEEKVQADDKKVDTLVQMYSNMKPQQAAKIFETMDEDLAVEILGRMKKKNAAEVMNLVKPEKAQIFSEKYAGYKRK